MLVGRTEAWPTHPGPLEKVVAPHLEGEAHAAADLRHRCRSVGGALLAHERLFDDPETGPGDVAGSAGIVNEEPAGRGRPFARQDPRSIGTASRRATESGVNRSVQNRATVRCSGSWPSSKPNSITLPTHVSGNIYILERTMGVARDAKTQPRRPFP